MATKKARASKPDSTFEGAVIVAAVPVTSRTAKVAQKLADGRIAVGTFFRDTEGTLKPGAGGVIVERTVLDALYAGVKSDKAVDLSTVEFPEPAPKAKRATLADLQAQIAELTAKLAA